MGVSPAVKKKSPFAGAPKNLGFGGAFKGDLEGLEGRGGSSFPTIEEALAAAFAEASPDDLIFIGGSNYVVGTALQSPYLTAPQNLSRRVETSPKE